MKSERLQIPALLAAIGLMFVSSLIVVTLGQRTILFGPLSLFLLLIVVFAGYEMGMLRFLYRCIAQNRYPAGYVWTVNMVIETCVPTLALFILTESEPVGPYRALSAPAVLVYVFFILFSILRLRAWLCVITGLVSSLGYLLVFAYTRIYYPEMPAGAYPIATYITFVCFIFIAGLAAAFVSMQIRKHVLAALREADTQRKIEHIEHDLNIARTIQRDLLPQTSPNIQGYDIAGWSQPADQTGGDYYDWQMLPNNQLAVSVADVTGHGIGPALVTAECRAYARAGFRANQQIGPVLNHINELLVEDLKEGRFITFVAALVDNTSPTVQMLSAGHGPILLYSRSEDSVEELHADDIPFGLTGDVGYGPGRSLPLNPGDIIAMITDGFFEWENESDEQFGIERLKTSLRNAKDLNAADIIQQLYTDVKTFVGNVKQNDDLTAVVIKRTAVQ